MTSNTPMVSVLMTVYNRSKYITAAIESVLASTYTDFELIIVDDRSTDNSVEIANAFAAKDARIKVYVNEKNLGDYPNRNKAASYATGKYIKYVDADDLIYPRGLEILVNTMEQFPSAGFGLCSLEPDKQRIFPFELSPEEAYRYHYKGPGLFHKAPLSAIIKKEAFLSAGGFSGKRMVGDFEMWHMLAQTNSVVLMQQGIVWYRSHEEQEMKDHRQYQSAYFTIANEWLSNSRCPLTDEERMTILKREQKKQARSVLYLIKQGKFGMFFSFLKDMRLSLFTWVQRIL